MLILMSGQSKIGTFVITNRHKNELSHTTIKIYGNLPTPHPLEPVFKVIGSLSEGQENLLPSEMSWTTKSNNH